MPANVEIPVEKWSGSVRQVTLGATAAEGGTRSIAVTIGGATTLPFLSFEGKVPNRPKVALEVRASNPGEDWPGVLRQAWGDALGDPAAWAKAAEAAGADLVVLQLTATDSAGQPMTGAPSWARPACRSSYSAPDRPSWTTTCWSPLLRKGLASGSCWVPAKTRTTGRSSRRPWRTGIWSLLVPQWTSIWPNS
jgi:hypothetical protein